jgi:hypothetical protein
VRKVRKARTGGGKADKVKATMGTTHDMAGEIGAQAAGRGVGWDGLSVGETCMDYRGWWHARILGWLPLSEGSVSRAAAADEHDGQVSRRAGEQAGRQAGQSQRTRRCRGAGVRSVKYKAYRRGRGCMQASEWAGSHRLAASMMTGTR